MYDDKNMFDIDYVRRFNAAFILNINILNECCFPM